MIIHVDFLVLALFSMLTSIIVVDATALPTALLQDRTTRSGPPPGEIKLHRRVNEGNELPSKPLTRSQSNAKQRYSTLLMATFLSENAERLVNNVKGTRINTQPGIELQLMHQAIFMHLTRVEIAKHCLAMLTELGHAGVSSNDHVEDTMWAVDDSGNPDIESKAKKLCYTRESPVRKTVDVLKETFTQLRQISQDIVKVDECAILQFIMHLNELCEIVYQGERVFFQ